MYRLLLLLCVAVCSAAYLSSPCTSEEILQPITDFNNLVLEMRSPHCDKNIKLEEIRSVINQVAAHYDLVNKTCGDEKLEGLAKLKNLEEDVDKAYNIIDALETNNLNAAKNLFESIICRYVLQFLITQIEYLMDNLDKMIDVTKIINDMPTMNKMHAGIIYTLNDTNINYGKLLVPVLKNHISKNVENPDNKIVETAKLNLQKLVERTVHKYPDALSALNVIDSNMAEQTIQDIVQHEFTNNIYNTAYDIVSNAPTFRLKALGLKAMHEKINSMKLQNSLVRTKLDVVAKTLNESEDNNNKKELSELFSDILQNPSEFNKGLVFGYSCRSLEEIETYITGEDAITQKHSDYYVFHDTDATHKNKTAVVTANEEGILLLINVEIMFDSKLRKYSVLMENGDYPDDISLPGTIVSKQRVNYEELTLKEICELDPPPQYYTCTPIIKILGHSYEEGIAVRKKSYQELKIIIQSCADNK